MQELHLSTMESTQFVKNICGNLLYSSSMASFNSCWLSKFLALTFAFIAVATVQSQQGLNQENILAIQMETLCWLHDYHQMLFSRILLCELMCGELPHLVGIQLNWTFSCSLKLRYYACGNHISIISAVHGVIEKIWPNSELSCESSPNANFWWEMLDCTIRCHWWTITFGWPNTVVLFVQVNITIKSGLICEQNIVEIIWWFLNSCQ